MPRTSVRVLPRNEKSIRKAATGAKGNYQIRDCKGLHLSANGSGRAVWRFRYNVPGQGQRWHTMGDVEPAQFMKAIAEADDIRASINRGDYPLSRARRLRVAAEEAERRERDSFDALMREWIDKHGRVKKRTWQRDLRRHEMHIAPRIGAVTLVELRKARIVALLDDIAEKVGPIEANRVQSQVSAALNWAVKRDMIETNPAAHLDKRGQERASERYLSDEEIRKVWYALEAKPPQIRDAIKILLLTGQRAGEVAGMRRTEISSAPLARWELPGKRTKNGEPHIVLLPEAASTLISRQKPKGDFIFPARGVEAKAMHVSTLSACFNDTARELALDPPGTPRHERATLHTLRHTVKTSLASLGVPESISDRVFNQISGQARRVGARYDHHLYVDEKRRALELWEKRLLEIVEGRKALGLRWA